MGIRRRYRRSNLFLVRLWATDGGDNHADDDDRDGSSDEKRSSSVGWRGKVQRVTDGETHQFSSLQGLMDLLQEMLSSNTGR
jgi:hypothetical protein